MLPKAVYFVVLKEDIISRSLGVSVYCGCHGKGRWEVRLSVLSFLCYSIPDSLCQKRSVKHRNIILCLTLICSWIIGLMEPQKFIHQGLLELTDKNILEFWILVLQTPTFQKILDNTKCFVSLICHLVQPLLVCR